MNSVERGKTNSQRDATQSEYFVVVQYSRGDLIPQEPPHEVEDTKPTPSWPQHGAITFDEITMSYRPGLPNVLKGISLDIKGGEKIGVVGR